MGLTIPETGGTIIDSTACNKKTQESNLANPGLLRVPGFSVLTRMGQLQTVMSLPLFAIGISTKSCMAINQYLLGMTPFLLKKRSAFCRFHSRVPSIFSQEKRENCKCFLSEIAILISNSS